jgi:AAA ATPase domain
MDRGAVSLRYPGSVTRVYGEQGQLEAKQGRARPRGGHALDEPPFIGRAREFRQIMQLLEVSSQSHGQVVVISGPAGIGKTRLAEEVALRARRRGVLVAIGRCWRDGEAPPLWPWRMVLRELGAPEGLLATHAADTAPGRFARFVAVLERVYS